MPSLLSKDADDRSLCVCRSVHVKITCGCADFSSPMINPFSKNWEIKLANKGESEALPLQKKTPTR